MDLFYWLFGESEDNTVATKLFAQTDQVEHRVYNFIKKYDPSLTVKPESRFTEDLVMILWNW
ncbi:MAG: hypothetical protein HY512_03520 [Candidatus Aenigmarchaeota archaeon]|nr:hypothetical protein [Candidatus Aenigmarchaeota archaeon]